MYIKTQDKKTIVNTDLVSSIKMMDHEDGTATIAAWTCNGYLVDLGNYPTGKAESILNHLFDAITDTCTFYEMPEAIS